MIRILIFVLLFSFCKNKDSEVVIKSEIQIISENIESNPKNVKLLYERVKYNINRSDLESAIYDLKECIKLDSLNHLFHFDLGKSYLELSKKPNSNVEYPAFAKKYLLKSIQLNQNEFKYTALLGELLLSYGRYQESINLFNKSLKLNYNQAKTHMLMGYAFKQLGNHRNAIDCFRNSLNIDPEFKESFIQLGNLFHLKKDTQAIIYYNNALKLDPNDEITLYNRALFYQDIQDWNKALEAYADLHKITPFHSAGHYNLGFIHMELSLYDIAANNFSDAIYSNSQFFEAYYSRGICFQALGNIKQAEIDFNRAIEINPNYLYAIEAIEGLKNINK